MIGDVVNEGDRLVAQPEEGGTTGTGGIKIHGGAEPIEHIQML